MGIRRIMMIGLMMAGALAPGAAQADERQVFVAAPYADAGANATCLDVVGVSGRCEVAEASADAGTGAFAMELLARTRDEGASVGVVTGSAVASFTASSARTAPTQAVLGVATVGLDELLAERSGTLPLVAPVDVWVEIALEHDACDACFGGGTTILSEEEAFEAPGTASVLAVMAQPSGDPVPPGVITASVSITAVATLAGVGEVHASVAGVLQRIELATPSSERVLRTPYAGAQADRNCDGSVGSTFECRSAAARTTGRIEMDLDVISPVAGTAPGSGSAFGGARITIEDEPSEAVRARVYVLDYAVDSAEAFVQGATPVIGRTDAALSASALATGPCAECASGSGAGIVDARGGVPTLLDELLHLSVWTRESQDAGASDARQITLAVDGASVVQNSSGIATAFLRSRLEGVRVYEIA